MSTTKLNTKVVNASVKSPAPASAPAADLSMLRIYKNGIFRRFKTEKTDSGASTYVVFEASDGRFYTALAHPAIRWMDKLGSKADIVVSTASKPWRLLLKPTAEEEAAYAKATAPQPKAYEEIKASKAVLDFLASF